MYYFCTYFDSNYISQGLTLFHSLVEHSDKDFKFYVLCLDEKTFNILKNYKNKSLIAINLNEVEEEYSELYQAKSNRNKIEYYFTLSPVFPLFLLKKFNISTIASIDSDLMFFSSPSPIFDEMDSYSIYITEHKFRDNFRSHEISGKYNVQCQIFRNDHWGIKCLTRWKDQCIEWCYDRHEKEKFADQKYLDEWPEIYKDHIMVSENIGVGVAPWNIEGEDIVLEDGKFYINNKPLIFYHFHGLKIFNRFFSKTGLSGFHATLNKPIRLIYINYIKEIFRHETFNEKKEIRPGKYGKLRLIMSGIKDKDLILHLN